MEGKKGDGGALERLQHAAEYTAWEVLAFPPMPR
jgi:hypothetical protein